MKQVGSSGGAGAGTERQRMDTAEARHRELDQRLRALGRRAFLTPTEQREVAELKKHKLRAKDELAALQRAG